MNARIVVTICEEGLLEVYSDTANVEVRFVTWTDKDYEGPVSKVMVDDLDGLIAMDAVIEDYEDVGHDPGFVDRVFATLATEHQA